MRWLGICIFMLAVVIGILSQSPFDHKERATLFSGAFEKPRNLASEKSVDGSFDDVVLAKEIDDFRTAVLDSSLDGARCHEVLSKTYKRLLAATPADFAPTVADREDYFRYGARYIQELFEAKLVLRKRIVELQAKGQASEECVSSARDVMRGTRVLEDIIGEFALNHPPYDEKNPKPVLKGRAPWLIVNPKFGQLKLKSGDVILSRGTAFTSAAIARIGDNDASFSHLTIIYIDPQTGAISTSEAHIEIGSVNAPFEKYLGDGKVRAVVFRHFDPILAHKAATMIKEKIDAYKKKHGENIPYDFSMDIKDSKAIFCSELVAHAFDLAKGSRAGVPAFTSKVNPKNRDFLSRLGIKATEAFLPTDIEMDPQFDLVAEWRDFSRLNVNHLHDAVLTAMYTWMERDGYVLHDTFGVEVKKTVIWHLRRWPLFSSLLDEKLPKNMSQKTIATVSMLDKVSELMYQRVATKNDENFKETGDWLTPAQMQEVLEDYRKEDLAAYNAKKSSGSLHRLFRPNK